MGLSVIVDEQEILNSTNEHFCNIGNELQSEKPDCDHRCGDYMPKRISHSFYLEFITSDDMIFEIKKLKHE